MFGCHPLQFQAWLGLDILARSWIFVQEHFHLPGWLPGFNDPLPRARTASGEWKGRLRLALWNLLFYRSGVFLLLKKCRKYSRMSPGAIRECPGCLLISDRGSINRFRGQRGLAGGCTFPRGMWVLVGVVFWSFQINSQVWFLVPCAHLSRGGRAL